MILDIKKCDIEDSWPGTPYNCAAARALKRQFPKETTIYVTANGNCHVGDAVYLGTKKLKAFIMRFDTRKKVEPTQFRLIRSKT